MAKDIPQAVREICFSLPEVEEVLSHGSPNFRVNNKTFATFVINHHGDGRLALWLSAHEGAQQYYTESDALGYFVPPYVGPKGWLGVNLDKGLPWKSVAMRVQEAYENVAPATLVDQIGDTIDIVPPSETIDPLILDPLSSPRAQEVLVHLRERCEQLPEVIEQRQFGDPVFRAGKKSFISVHSNNARILLMFWVGAEQQGAMTFDARFTIPKYMGHNGWITLDVQDKLDWDEIEDLMMTSYRHFALKRMLKSLDGV